MVAAHVDHHRLVLGAAYSPILFLALHAMKGHLHDQQCREQGAHQNICYLHLHSCFQLSIEKLLCRLRGFYALLSHER